MEQEGKFSTISAVVLGSLLFGACGGATPSPTEQPTPFPYPELKDTDDNPGNIFIGEASKSGLSDYLQRSLGIDQFDALLILNTMDKDVDGDGTQEGWKWFNPDGSYKTSLTAKDFQDYADNDDDTDGMSDAWEVQYFGNCDRDGKGDFDGDKTLDLDEFTNHIDPRAVYPGTRVIPPTETPLSDPVFPSNSAELELSVLKDLSLLTEQYTLIDQIANNKLRTGTYTSTNGVLIDFKIVDEDTVIPDAAGDVHEVQVGYTPSTHRVDVNFKADFDSQLPVYAKLPDDSEVVLYKGVRIHEAVHIVQFLEYLAQLSSEINLDTLSRDELVMFLTKASQVDDQTYLDIELLPHLVETLSLYHDLYLLGYDAGPAVGTLPDGTEQKYCIPIFTKDIQTKPWTLGSADKFWTSSWIESDMDGIGIDPNSQDLPVMLQLLASKESVDNLSDLSQLVKPSIERWNGRNYRVCDDIAN